MFSLENFSGFGNTSCVVTERSDSDYVEQKVNTPRLDLPTETELIALTLLFVQVLEGTRTIRQNCLDGVISKSKKPLEGLVGS